MTLAFIEKVVFAYLQAHPELVEKLVERLVTRLLDRLAVHGDTPAA